jgi:hypothetical protein
MPIKRTETTAKHAEYAEKGITLAMLGAMEGSQEE